MLRFPRLSACILIAAAFILSRLLYFYSFGVHLDPSPLNDYGQYLDPQLLRHDLLRSLYYLHAQPPAFNLFLGVILKLFPDNFALAFQFIYYAMGLAIPIFLFLLMDKLSVKRPLAIALPILFFLCPTTVIHENWLFYSYPITCFLTASAYFLLLYLETYKHRYAICFFTFLSFISCMHPMFGLLWLIVVGGLLLILQKKRRLLTLCYALIPIALMLALAIKQYAVFGTFTTGKVYMNVNIGYRIALNGEIPKEKREELIRTGKVPPYFFTFPVFPLRWLDPNYMPPPPTGIPALDDETKSTGHVNFNCLGYLQLSEGYMKGGMELLKSNPEYYYNSFGDTIYYFRPGIDDVVAKKPEEKKLLTLQNTVNSLFGWQFRKDGPCWMLIFGFPTLIVFALTGIFKQWKSRAENPRPILLAFLAFNILYASAIPVLVTWADYSRYRFTIDPFYLILLGMFMTICFQKLKTPATKEPAAEAAKPAEKKI